MILEIQKPYTEIINKFILSGVGSSPEEIVKQSLLVFAKQFDFQDEYLPEKAVEIETDSK